MYNKIILLGRITHNLELKVTANDVPVLSFSVAVERQYQEKGKEKQTDFFNCIAWRNEAEFISRFWSKGRAILIEGEMQSRKYTDKNNIERQLWEVIVDRASFTGEKSERENVPPPEVPPQYASKTPETPPAPEKPDRQMTAEDFAKPATDDDNYPF